MIVYKLDADGNEELSYPATPIKQTATSITVRAIFSLDVTTAYTTFARGDHLHEHFYTDRWYNIFALYAGDSDTLKGWYCNICRPAKISPNAIRCEDLALDVWVNPDGTHLILDKDEFANLNLSPAEKDACQQAVSQLIALAQADQLPR